MLALRPDTGTHAAHGDTLITEIDPRTLSAEQALELTRTLRDEAAVDALTYRRLIRASGFRGFSGGTVSHRVRRALRGHESALEMAYKRTPDGTPMTDSEGRPHIDAAHQRMWNEIVTRRLQGVEQTDERPRALVLSGGPGSGKSSVRAAAGLTPDNAFAIDPDELLMELPHVRDLVATGDPGALSAPVYAEKKVLQRMCYEAGRARRANLVLDVTGSGPTFAAELSELASHGYHIDLVYVDCNLHEAIDRATIRGRRDGRFMTDEVIASCHAGAAARFDELHAHPALGSVRAYATDLGEPATLLAERVGDAALAVYAQERLDAFRAKRRGDGAVSAILGYGEDEVYAIAPRA